MDASRNEGDKSTYTVASEMLFYEAAFATDTSEVNMANGMKRNWRELCLAVTKESDSTKFSWLVQELIEALDRRERSWPSDSVRLETQNREDA